VRMIVHFKGGDVRWEEVDATLVDVSRQGMLVRCERQPQEGERVLVGMVYRAHGLCAAWGRTVRLDERGFGIALRRSDERWNTLIDDLFSLSPARRSQYLAGHATGRLWVERAVM